MAGGKDLSPLVQTRCSSRAIAMGFHSSPEGLELASFAQAGPAGMMMIHFVRNHFGRQSGTEQRFALGHLERNVMDILWSRGASSVRDVAQGMDRQLAYTTVMTTLDRLFKKNFLDRTKSERAYLYSPRISRAEWERRRAGDLVAGFLAGPQPARELLLSCLLDAVGEHDAVLLDALEKKIKSKRRELFRRGRP